MNHKQAQDIIDVVKNLNQSYLGVGGAGQELIRKGAPVHPALKSKLMCAALSVSSPYGRGGAKSNTDHQDLNPLGLI